MQTLAKLAFAVLAAGIGVAVAYRLSTESMAVVVGMVCGLSALIPFVLITLALLRQSQTPSPGSGPPPQGPPVIVIQPGPTQPAPWMPSPPAPPQPPVHTSEPPDFRIIGDE